MELTEQVFAAIRRYEALRATRRVFPDADALVGLGSLGGALPAAGVSAERVVELLEEFAAPATVMTTGPRFFGFVTGGALPAAQAANWLGCAWDQNGALRVMSPVAAELENIALGWIASLLEIPDVALGSFVTGATMANFTGLAAARHALLAKQGWDVEALGLFGAPRIQVVVSDEAHVALVKALAMLGLGRDRVVRVPTDAQGRMRVDAFPQLSEPAIVCLQAGNVNTGALDPAEELIALARQSGSWVHVDGAFGLWAKAAPGYRELARGYEAADSWATDAHKWLNVPYDSGLVFVRDPAAMTGAMGLSASYLTAGAGVEAMNRGPEASRRARGMDAWAALRSLGVDGVAELIDRCCRLARRFAAGLASGGVSVLNEVCLNQAMVALDDDEQTLRWIEEVQREGVCWCGGTVWHGRRAMRISVSSWATSEADVDLSIESMLRCAGLVRTGADNE